MNPDRDSDPLAWCCEIGCFDRVVESSGRCKAHLADRRRAIPYSFYNRGSLILSDELYPYREADWFYDPPAVDYSEECFP